MIRDHFDPEQATLTLGLPLPPPDNHCHLSTRGGGRYPSAAYKDWLGVAAPQLRELLRGWEPDRERWWEVHGELWLGSQGDPQNYLKPALDLLTGAYVVERTFDDERGRKIAKGTILKPGGLWDDDRRVRIASWEPLWVRHETPWLTLFVRPWASAPRDWKAEQAQAERDRKAKARESARQEREAARALRTANRSTRSRKGDPNATAA